jgi:hypothetical protein
MKTKNNIIMQIEMSPCDLNPSLDYFLNILNNQGK